MVYCVIFVWVFKKYFDCSRPSVLLLDVSGFLLSDWWSALFVRQLGGVSTTLQHQSRLRLYSGS